MFSSPGARCYCRLRRPSRLKVNSLSDSHYPQSRRVPRPHRSVQISKEPSQKKALSAFLINSYSVSLLTAKVPTLLPLSAEKTACIEKVSLFPHPGANEIGTSTERVDEGAIGPTGSGIDSRTLALHPWFPILETIVKLFSSVCVVAELPPLDSATCHRRRPADPALWIAAAITVCPQ